MTVLPVIKKMIDQTEKFKETLPSDSKAHRDLTHIGCILADVFDQMIFNSLDSNSYNDNIN